jgi:hypothetical protein
MRGAFSCVKVEVAKRMEERKWIADLFVAVERCDGWRVTVALNPGCL